MIGTVLRGKALPNLAGSARCLSRNGDEGIGLQGSNRRGDVIGCGSHAPSRQERGYGADLRMETAP